MQRAEDGVETRSLDVGGPLGGGEHRHGRERCLVAGGGEREQAVLGVPTPLLARARELGEHAEAPGLLG